MRETIMVVECSKELNSLLRQRLREQGLRSKSAISGTNTLSFLQRDKPNLIILDLELPDLEGMYVFNEIRKLRPETPIIIISNKNERSTMLKCFQNGATDFIVKPFDIEELLARIKVRLEPYTIHSSIYKIGDLTLDDNQKKAFRGGNQIILTPREFELLKYLMTNRERVLTRDMILSKVWYDTDTVVDRVVDVYIGYLRTKIDKNYRHKLIQTIRGFGYQIREK